MQKHELYGVKMVHPVNCMVPGFIDTLPHQTGDPIYFMHSRADAHRYAQICGHGRNTVTATTTLYGHEMRDKAVMPAVAIVYKVMCPDDVYKQLQSQIFQSAPVKFGSLEGMEIHPIEAYVQEDPLHSAGRYSIYEIGSEIANRWNDYRELNIALENSTPAQLKLLDFNDANIRGALRLMYGEAGRINSDFFTAYSNEDHLMSIERVMHKGHVGVGYMMNILTMEAQYQDTYHTLTNEGYSKEYAAAAAAKEMAQTLQVLSGLYGDKEADVNTFAPLVAAYDLSPERADENETPVEPSYDDVNIFK